MQMSLKLHDAHLNKSESAFSTQLTNSYQFDNTMKIMNNRFRMLENSPQIFKYLNCEINNNQGPVVQSVVSLTSSLRVISLTVLADSIYNILIFFAEKM